MVDDIDIVSVNRDYYVITYLMGIRVLKSLLSSQKPMRQNIYKKRLMYKTSVTKIVWRNLLLRQEGAK